jgi:hypothetical protein
VSLSEIPNGRTIKVMTIVLALIGLVAVLVGTIIIKGIWNDSKSEAEWNAYQSEHQVTYQDYLKKNDHANNLLGIVLIAEGIVLVYLAALTLASGKRSYQKCLNGHVTHKDNDKKFPMNYCHICGVKLYTQDELSSDEWKKRYERV